MIYSIVLFTKGRKVDKAPSVYFTSQEVKDTYITEEGKFCLKEYNEYLSSDFGKRESTQKELDKKRIAFAVHKGYREKRGNKFIWEKEKPTKEPKQYA